MSKGYDKYATLIPKKVVPVHFDAYFSSYDHFRFERVHLIRAYENKIRFSKKSRYIIRTNSWVKFTTRKKVVWSLLVVYL